MKKKFINGLLLVALFVGFTGSMVSCKDYDDEKLTELDGRVAQLEKSLRQALADQKAELLAEIAKLQNALDECKSTCAAFREEVNNKFKLYVTLTELETKLGDYYTKNETYNRTEIENLITTSLSNYYTKAEIDDLLKNLDLSKYAEKTWVEGKIAELKNYVDEELKKYVQASALEQTIVDMLSNSEGKLYKALETYFLNNKAITDYIEGVAEAAGQKYYAQAVIYIDQQIREVNAELATVKQTAENALQLAGENKEKISELDEELGNLSEIVGILGDLLEQVSDIANEAKAKAETNSKLIENLQTLYGELKGQVDGIDSKLNILRDEFDQAVEDLAGLAEEVAAN